MNLERVTTLLASGIQPSQVASIIGCSPARISQLYNSSEEFKNLLAEKKALADKQSEEEEILTTKYHAAEHILIKQIIDLAPASDMRDVTAALRVVSERQDKVKTRCNPIQPATIINQVVAISIPNHTLPEIHLTKDREVTSVNAFNIAPLTSQGVTNLFKEMKKERELEELAKIEDFAEQQSSSQEFLKLESFRESKQEFLKLQEILENKEKRNEPRTIPSSTEETSYAVET